MKLDVRGDTRRMIRDLDRIQRQIVPAATASALNKTATEVKNEGARAVAADRMVPVREAKRKIVFPRSFRAVAKASRRVLAAQLVFYMRPVKAIRLLTTKSLVKQLYKRRGKYAGGIRAGKHYFPGAFIAEGRNEQAHVFRRRGAPRLPLDVMEVPLEPARGVMDRTVARLGGKVFRKKFEAELQFRLGTRPRP